MDSSENKPRKRGFRPPLVIIAFAAILLLVLVLGKAMPGIRGQGNVPNVVGLPLNEATMTLLEAGFSLQVTTLTGAPPQDDWRVISQDPVSVQIAVGDTVRMEVTPPVLLLPDVYGLTIEDATARLEAAGFTVVGTSNAPSETLEEGLVIEVDNQVQHTLQGSPVRLRVSSGPERLPDFSGVETEDARRIFHRMGLRVNDVTFVERTDMPNRVIVRTVPGPEASLAEVRKTGMSIVVSRSAEEK